jgi:thiosulfate/3-mercaptopyruvate sulfurtransferase
MLIDAGQLSAHAADPEIVILHVDVDRRGFERGHIPSARFVDARIFLAGDSSGARLAALDTIADSLRALGLSNESRVVLYGSPLPVARAFLALDVLGHGDRVAVLDGGLSAWRERGSPTTTREPSPGSGDFAGRPEGWRIVSARWLRDTAEASDVALVDARSEGEFEDGHLPGARNLDWRLTLRGGVDADVSGHSRLRSVAELRWLFRTLGLDDADEIVIYSDDGSLAAHLYFVARYLGYQPRYLGGSWRDAQGGTGP